MVVVADLPAAAYDLYPPEPEPELNPNNNSRTALRYYWSLFLHPRQLYLRDNFGSGVSFYFPFLAPNHNIRRCHRHHHHHV